MATQYTGDRTALEIPASIPDDGVSPIAVVPEDGDDLNASSVLQPFKVAMDFIDYCTHRFTTFPGVRDYEAARTYTAGMMCLSTDGMTYRVKTGQSSINILPQDNATKWERWGYSDTELAAAIPYNTTGTGQIAFPGGFMLKWAACIANDLPTEATASKVYTFPQAFAHACLGVWLQPSSYSVSHDAGCPQVLAGSLTASQCTLVRPDTDATGEIATGYLFAIGY